MLLPQVQLSGQMQDAAFNAILLTIYGTTCWLG